MRPTFLLTRVFAVSALVAQVTYGAPVAEHQPVVAVAVGVEGANVAREIPSVVARERVSVEERAEARSPETDGSMDILKRMCMMVWGCKRG